MDKLNIWMSGIDRVMKCSGFLDFKELLNDPDTTKRDEGTAAAEYFERKILGLPIGTQSRKGVPFTEDMPFYLDPAVREIESRGKGIQVETKCDWQTRSGIWIKGKFDVSYTDQDDNLCIDDLKWGFGIVEPMENWQLIAYAIGEVIRRGRSFNKIVLRIIQPRPHHEDGWVRSWELTYNELLTYKEKIEKRMDIIAAGDNTLNTGVHCKYCPAAHNCPAMSKAFYRSVDVVHEFLEDSVSDEELAFQLELINRMDEIIKIKKSSMELLAVTRIKEGKLIGNYTIENSLGDRKWKGNVTPDLIKMLSGIDVTQVKMLSPAQAEKLGLSKDLVTQMVDRPVLGPKLKRSKHDIGDKIFGKQQPKGVN